MTLSTYDIALKLAEIDGELDRLHPRQPNYREECRRLTARRYVYLAMLAGSQAAEVNP